MTKKQKRKIKQILKNVFGTIVFLIVLSLIVLSSAFDVDSTTSKEDIREAQKQAIININSKKDK